MLVTNSVLLLPFLLHLCLPLWVCSQFLLKGLSIWLELWGPLACISGINIQNLFDFFEIEWQQIMGSLKVLAGSSSESICLPVIMVVTSMEKGICLKLLGAIWEHTECNGFSFYQPQWAFRRVFRTNLEAQIKSITFQTSRLNYS